MARHVVAAVAEVPPGTRRRVLLKGHAVALFNLGGEFFALLDKCPHQGASLHEGRLGSLVESTGPGDYRTSREGEILRCPWHAWAFDIRTGQSWCDPGRIRARSFPADVIPGSTLCEGPYVATTLPVHVEEDYVVIEL
jgi:3-phenylpropionate/trans-cinnamate dioxygenase ferredoxin subunit